MRIEHLIYLQEIVKKKSFTNAAEALYISQQSLSEIVAKIEEQFHFKIFNRSRKGAQLTEEGAAFMADVDVLLAQYELILNKYGRQAEEYPVLSVCINPIVANFSVEQMIAEFREMESPIGLSIVEERTPLKVLQQVEQGLVEVGITTLPAAIYKHHEIMQKVHIEGLYLDYLCLLVRKDHPLAERTSVSFEEFIDEPLVLDGDGRLKEDLLAYYYKGMGVRPLQIVMETTSDVYIKLITKGEAVGFITKMQFNLRDYPDLRVVPLKDVEPLRLVIATPLVAKMPAAVNSLVQTVIHSLEDQEQETGVL